jgi:hypothetical protein
MYVQGSPKDGDALCLHRVLNTRLGLPLICFGEVPMVRKVVLYIEYTVIAAIQVAGIASAIVGLWPASAQTPPPSNPNLIQDFMAALPPSDNMRKNASYNAESPHPFEASPATYRIYNHKNGKAKQALLQQAETGFTAECGSKGGAIVPRDAHDYTLAIERLRPAAPDATILICMKPDQTALGMLITLKRTIRSPNPSGDLTGAALGRLFDAPYYLISLQPPSSVYTQARIEREAADLAAREKRKAGERERAAEQEYADAVRWRKTIQTGTETGCGPVLSVKGDLIEVIHYQTREPRWYRRAELWPTLYHTGGMRTCK